MEKSIFYQDFTSHINQEEQFAVFMKIFNDGTIGQLNMFFHGFAAEV